MEIVLFVSAALSRVKKMWNSLPYLPTTKVRRKKKRQQVYRGYIEHMRHFEWRKICLPVTVRINKIFMKFLGVSTAQEQG